MRASHAMCKVPSALLEPNSSGRLETMSFSPPPLAVQQDTLCSIVCSQFNLRFRATIRTCSRASFVLAVRPRLGLQVNFQADCFHWRLAIEQKPLTKGALLSLSLSLKASYSLHVLCRKLPNSARCLYLDAVRSVLYCQCKCLPIVAMPFSI